MQFKPAEKEPHRRVKDKAVLDKVHALRIAMHADIESMTASIPHAAQGRGGFRVDFPDKLGPPIVQYDELEVCPDSMRAWREQAQSYADGVKDLCKLLGVDE